jgi:acetylornithine deacetylase/succinyl-diaminopimelate desuccinylase-like protein
MSSQSFSELLETKVNRARLLDTAQRLVAVPSPTGEAGAAADCLAELLRADGFDVERPVAGHAAAPAVVVRYRSGRPGRTLQFDGHLDTVHLPFFPPRVVDGQLTGSGASDMKGGLAAAIEALRSLRDASLPSAGDVLLVAHDLHEAPWGLGEQLNRLIADGVHGDAVLIPEPLCDRLPIVGRGAGTWKVTFRRAGSPVHEVMRSADEPSVIAAGARFIAALGELSAELSTRTHPLAGSETVFVGQIHSGEIYNQYPQECWVEGTRRWLPDGDANTVERSFRDLVERVAKDRGVMVDVDWRTVRGAFALDMKQPLVESFQTAYAEQSGQKLVTGPKAFVDDGNSFWSLAGVPAITHGPRAGGQHTVNEWVDIDDLVRVAKLYSTTAALFCPNP